jgi:Bax inhibitor 1
MDMGRKSSELASSSSSFSSLQTVLELGEIPEHAQSHLRLVYTALSATFLCAVLGATLGIAILPAISPILAFMASMAIIFAIHCDSDKENVPKRMALLSAFGFLEGVVLAPLVNMAIEVDPYIIITALICTCLIFGCFSLAALVAKRRSFLFLGGVLSSALTMLIVLSVMSVFVPALKLIWLQIYGGLVLFSAFVVYDTQIIIERAAAGSKDFAGHALTLFLDFANIFVRILRIYLQNRNGGSRSSSSAPLLPTHRGEL